ncbi:hypothetical protein ACFX11_039638 [Malus domestica]
MWRIVSRATPTSWYESGVRDGKKQISNDVDECDEAGTRDEVDRGGGYGGLLVMIHGRMWLWPELLKHKQWLIINTLRQLEIQDLLSRNFQRDPKFTRNQRSIFALNYIPLRLSHPHINRGETKFRQASMEWYSYQRRISSSSSRGYPYRRLDNFVTAYDEEEDNEKSEVVLRQRQISDLNFKYTKRRGISKLPQKIMSSIVLLKRCRDAYVEVMLSFAEHVVQLNGGNSYL